MLGDLPDRRQSIRGTDLDGNELVLAFSIARKLYTCPHCRAAIDVGREHVLVRYLSGERGRFHQHWHRDCALGFFRREIPAPRAVPAS